MSTISEDFQMELQDLLMGHGTNYGNRKLMKGWGIPSIRSDDKTIPAGHGETFYGDFLSSRSLITEFHVFGDTPEEAEDHALTLKGAWAPVEEDVPLWFRLAGDERVVYGRPRGCEISADRLHVGRMVAVTRFECSDPRLYAADLTTLNGTVPSATGGLHFPASATFSFGPGSDFVVLAAENEGLIDTPWTAVISGPCVGPRLELVGTDKALDFGTLDIAAGETLELDSANQTALLNGLSSRYGYLASDHQWWNLPPGSSSMRFRADGQTGSIALSFRSAWP